MKRSKVLGIGVGITGGALALAMVLGGATGPQRGVDPARPGSGAHGASAGGLARRGCDLHPGDRLGFSVRTRSSNVMSAGKLLGPDQAPAMSAGPRETRTVEGDLLLRVLDAEAAGGAPGKLTLAAVFDHPDVRVGGTPAAALQEDLSVPVLFEMDTECRLYGFAPSAPIGPAASNLWKGTLNMAEMVIAAPGTLRSWKSEQADTTGTFVASYDRREGEDGASTIRRTRSAFTALHDDARGAASVSILRSSATATYLPGASFFRDLQVEEHLVLAMNGATMADVEATMTLRGKDVEAAAGEFWTRDLRASDLAFTPLDERTAAPPPLPYTNRPPIEGLRDRPLPAILADVGTFLAQKPQPDFDGALNLLVQSLRTDPARAAALLDQVRTGGLGADEASMVFLSLGLAGGKEATAALTAALQDSRLSESHRLQALSALAGVPDPDAAVTDTLLQVREPRGAAVLALGTLAHNPHLAATEKGRISAALEDELRRAQTPADRAGALAALGNAGDPAMREQVAAFTESAEPGVAAAAYRTLEKMGALPAAGELLDAYSKAKDAPTQAAIAAVLPSAKLGASDVARAAGLLAAPQPPGTRAALIRLLGAAAHTDAAAKAALVRQLRVETEPSLLSLIGRYLDASDLM